MGIFCLLVFTFTNGKIAISCEMGHYINDLRLTMMDFKGGKKGGVAWILLVVFVLLNHPLTRSDTFLQT